MFDLIEAYKADMSTLRKKSRVSHAETVILWKNQCYNDLLEALQPFIFTQAMIHKGRTDSTSMEPTDLVSVANLAALAAIKSWNPGLEKSVKLTTWIARRIRTNVLRSIQASRIVEVSIEETLDKDNSEYGAQWLLAKLQDDSNNPEKAAMAAESLQTGLALADQLPERQQQALLASWEGETRAEIAESMGISSQAVGKLLTKANKYIKGVSNLATA